MWQVCARSDHSISTLSIPTAHAVNFKPRSDVLSHLRRRAAMHTCSRRPTSAGSSASHAPACGMCHGFPGRQPAAREALTLTRRSAFSAQRHLSGLCLCDTTRHTVETKRCPDHLCANDVKSLRCELQRVICCGRWTETCSMWQSIDGSKVDRQSRIITVHPSLVRVASSSLLVAPLSQAPAAPNSRGELFC